MMYKLPNESIFPSMSVLLRLLGFLFYRRLELAPLLCFGAARRPILAAGSLKRIDGLLAFFANTKPDERIEW